MNKRTYTHNKQCIGTLESPGCGLWKNKKNHFYKTKNSKDGYRNKCKVCMNLADKKIVVREDPFYDRDLIEMSKLHKAVRYNPFGFFIGVLIIFRRSSTMACSVISDKKQVFKTQLLAKEFLVRELNRASDRVSAGLLKPRKRG